MLLRGMNLYRIADVAAYYIVQDIIQCVHSEARDISVFFLV